MIVQFDVNTIWRRKFGEALRRRYPDMLLMAPRIFGAKRDPGGVTVSLPPGWADKSAAIAMPMLQWRVEALAARKRSRIDTAIFTSFHYLPIARRLQPRTRILYYCSDDYRSYAGWSSAAAIEREAELCRLSSLSIFVSEALRDRAIAEYGLDPAKSIVSPNASEARFSEAASKPAELNGLDGPVFGVVGVFNERIDYGFLEELAASAEIGSLALVGPVLPGADQTGALDRLRANAKVHWFGARPHEDLHAWMGGLDVAVIPYARSDFNHFCSPMRLWDHLANGQPILATDACDQITHQPEVIVTSSGDDLDRAIRSAKTLAIHGRRPHLESWDDRAALVVPLIDTPLISMGN